ncbi:MAG TPA: hypothetical protein VH397_11470 [Xanthobacteraceae bacterium]
MFITKEIDRIVEAFIPEMTRIWDSDQDEDQKERQTKAWLRATLQKFAHDVAESEQKRAPAAGAVRSRSGKPFR